MQIESATEKRTIVSRKATGSSLDGNGRRQPDIESARREILVLLSIELVVMTSYFILQLIALIADRARFDQIDTSIIVELCITTISIVYVMVFIVVVTEYFPANIFIFNCLTLIQLTGGCILLILSIMAMVVSLSLIHNVGMGIMLDAFYILVALFIIGLSVSIIIASMNLRKLIKT